MPPKGVCVFDLDRTLTCEGGECHPAKVRAMEASMDACARMGMKKDVATARPLQEDMLWGVPAPVRKRLENSDARIYFRSKPHLTVEEEKLQHMQRICRDRGVPYGHAVLIDDRKATCAHLEAKGHPTVHVQDENGITSREKRALVRKLLSLRDSRIRIREAAWRR